MRRRCAQVFPSALAKRARAASLLFSVSSAAWTHLLAGSGGLAYGSLVPAPLYDTLPAQRRELQTRAP